jgi:hypothetical protein
MNMVKIHLQEKIILYLLAVQNLITILLILIRIVKIMNKSEKLSITVLRMLYTVNHHFLILSKIYKYMSMNIYKIKINKKKMWSDIILF